MKKHRMINVDCRNDENVITVKPQTSGKYVTFRKIEGDRVAIFHDIEDGWPDGFVITLAELKDAVEKMELQPALESVVSQ